MYKETKGYFMAKRKGVAKPFYEIEMRNDGVIRGDAAGGGIVHRPTIKKTLKLLYLFIFFILKETVMLLANGI